MKIKDSVKGIKDILFEEPIPADDDNDIISGEDAKEQRQKIREENYKIISEWHEQGQLNVEILLKQDKDTNGIGKRLEFILRNKNIEKTEFALRIGVSRTTIHRYISGDSKPSKDKLSIILNQLQISEADFSYSPSDFEAWKNAFDLEPDYKGRNILAYRQEVLAPLQRNNFVYLHNGKAKPLPQEYFLLMKAIIENGLKVFDDLLPHDENFAAFMY